MARLTILADSRGFDTYYLNDFYSRGYGYHQTFGHLLAVSLARRPELGLEAVHIPDHFRGGSVESNILRLALTDPDVVVLLNGIWETLLHKGHFLEWAKARLYEFDTRSGLELDLRYSSRRLADLFMGNELPVSPARFAERERRIVSYFRRRGRQVIYLTLPVPGLEHLNRAHYAGNHRCIPEWGECLAAVNREVAPQVSRLGARVVDLDALMAAEGGPGRCLIDQWHFSPEFHAAIAAVLEHEAEALAGFCLPPDHVSRSCMPGSGIPGEPVLVCGVGERAKSLIRANPAMRVEAVVMPEPDRTTFQSVPVIAERHVPRAAARVVVLCVEPEDIPEAEARLVDLACPGKVVLLPEEMKGIVNPLVRGQAEG